MFKENVDGTFEGSLFQFSLAYLNSSFQAIQLSIRTHFSSIWPIHSILSGATIPDQSGPGSDGNEGVPRIPHSFRITETSQSDYLVSNRDMRCGMSNRSGEKIAEFYSSC